MSNDRDYFGLKYHKKDSRYTYYKKNGWIYRKTHQESIKKAYPYMEEKQFMSHDEIKTMYK